VREKDGFTAWRIDTNLGDDRLQIVEIVPVVGDVGPLAV